MSDDQSGLSKAELRKARKDAKKDVKQTKVVKAVERAANEKDQEDSPKPAKEPKQKPPKSEPKPAEKPVPVAPAPAAVKAPVGPTVSSSATSATVVAPVSASEPSVIKPIVHMFMSDFPDDWTSGAVPLLASLRRLLVSIAQQDEHDCSLAAASAALKSKDRGSNGDELLRHFDEAHLRPFLANKLGLVSNNNSQTAGAVNGTAAAPTSRKTLLQVGHLAVIKWVRELVLSQRIDASSSQTSQSQQDRQKLPASLGVVDFLSSLSDSLLDIYIERIQLAADGVCRFGSEILASCTTSRPISPAFPVFWAPLTQLSAFPSSILVTLSTCSCHTSTSAFNAGGGYRPPAISQLVSRALAMTDSIIDKQRQIESQQDGDSDLSDESQSSDGEAEDEPDEGAFKPPCLTVVVATPGCCANNCQQFDKGELSDLSSITVFSVPLSRIGSAVANGSVSAVLLPADAVLANRGCAVLAPRGSGMLALAARSQWHCPVIVLAETYKIIAGGQEEIDESLKGLVPASAKGGRPTTELSMDDADVISAESISVVVTELGAVPAAALPSILRLSQKVRPSRGLSDRWQQTQTQQQDGEMKTP